MFRILVWTAIFVSFLIAGYWWIQKEPGIDPALKSIALNYVNPDGTLYDPTNSIGVSSIENLGFEKKGNTLYITYGKQAFKVNLEKNINDAAQYLRSLGLTIETDQTGNVVLKYQGEVVKEFE